MPVKKQVAVANSLSRHYEQLTARGDIKDDPAQREVISALEALSATLADAKATRKKPAALPMRGIYLWGDVGRGKSMLMDLFFAHAPVENKRRVHFHAFMQEVHARIHKLRQEKMSDPVVVLAYQMAQENSLICFDELQAADVADATLLYRLFTGLFDAGVTVVSTSNRPPVELYTGGVQRERFNKFITLITDRMQVMSLTSTGDYRHRKTKNRQPVYHYPLGRESEAFIASRLKGLLDISSPAGEKSGGGHPRREILAVHGRKTAFTLYGDAIGRFTFHELCESALGAADYLALAKRIETLILTDIPKLPAEKRNEAKRFVTLIDTLYEHNVRIICTAAVPPQEIYAVGDGAFEFQRTVSRLVEMQSENYGGDRLLK
ncbi:MAG: AFG1 family ATPase [Pseudomonadota bacterium]|nr:AFG1 family ATPase [Pseudomonadota bacterium]MDE3038219.1 AFG1 family ATPase [Pseudomonadota bacterium]